MSGLETKIAYAEEQIKSYLAAMEHQNEDDAALAKKLETYQKLKAEYEAKQEELRSEGLEQKSLTDPDSRRMKNNGALDICYNVQAVIDSKHHFAIEAEATSDINDLNQLSPMAQKAKELVEPEEMAAVADTGYYHGEEIKECVDAGITVYVKKGKSNNGTNEDGYRKDKFRFDAERDCYVCPEGRDMPFAENTTKHGKKFKKYRCADCNNCPKKKLCTTSVKGRVIERWEHESVLEKVNENTLANHDIYKQRRCIVEHPFGTIKRQWGYTYFLRKRRENVDAECSSIFIAYNLRRLLSMLSVPELIEKFQDIRRRYSFTFFEKAIMRMAIIFCPYHVPICW